MRRLVVAGAILATFLTVPLSMAAAAPAPTVAVSDSARATAALEYLLAAQKADGSIDGTLGETADFVIGAAATGYDPATIKGCSGGTGALDFIATKSDAATTDAGATGQAILAVVAAGGDPASFSGRNLTARLAALYDSATGAYGDGSTISQSYAILAFVALGGSVPVAATDKLIALQGTDGAWTYGATKEAGDGDSNSTAVALMALNAARVTDANATALAYLHTQQVDDGGFAYSTAWGAVSDADSDAEVLQALISAGEDPIGSAWAKGAGNVLTALRAAQGADGGFNYQTYGESAFTTREIPAALMGVPYAVAMNFTAGLSVPKSSCVGAGPTPSGTTMIGSGVTATPRWTPTPVPTPVPTLLPTARPTVRPTARPTAVPVSSQTTTPTPTPAESVPETPTPTSTLIAAEIVAAETAAASAAPA
ncbi:MAG TPA: hypothetical protein VF337_05385, partial [Candidatus Limnocylindrales bacterium]